MYLRPPFDFDCCRRFQSTGDTVFYTIRKLDSVIPDHEICTMQLIDLLAEFISDPKKLMPMVPLLLIMSLERTPTMTSNINLLNP